MKVLIAKQNEPIFKNWRQSIKFASETKNTSSFRVPEKEFQMIYNWVKREGYNPFALMSW